MQMEPFAHTPWLQASPIATTDEQTPHVTALGMMPPGVGAGLVPPHVPLAHCAPEMQGALPGNDPRRSHSRGGPSGEPHGQLSSAAAHVSTSAAVSVVPG